MRSWWFGAVAAALIAVGAAGLALVAAQSGAVYAPSGGRTVAPAGATVDGFTSAGERLYYTGVGHAGPVARVSTGNQGYGGMQGSGMMGGGGCVSCHGADGRGRTIGMMGPAIEVPDIRYVTLVSPHGEMTGTAPGWTDAQIAEAIRRGVEPNGKPLDAPMPRWEMDDTDMLDVIGYLKELSRS